MVAYSRQVAPPRVAGADLLLRAVDFHKRGDFARAEDAYRRLCALDPRNIQALHLLGLLMTQTGRCEIGVELIDRALAIKPDFLDALNSRGNALLSLGRLEDALAAFDRALKINSRFTDALINRGSALKRLLRHDEALQSFDRALRSAPDSAEAHQNRGATLRAMQRHDEALAAYDRALAIRPAYLDAVFNRGQALLELRRFAEALIAFDRALALQPQHVEALCRRGEALAQLQREAEALATCGRALALDPFNLKTLVACGDTLQRLHRSDEALALADRGLAIAPEGSDLLNLRGNALVSLGRLEEALAAYDRALAADSCSVVLLHNRGNALGRMKRLDEARASYDRGLALCCEHASTRTNRAFLSLACGDFAVGWAEYEYRFGVDDHRPLFPPVVAPSWRGEAIKGKSILVDDEQGLGDALQFCRYLPLLADLGAEATFRVRPTLERLMRMSFPALRVTSQPPGESFDFQCALMSLPHAFGTTLETIPNAAPYVATDPARVEKWRARLGAEGFKIGITWRGSAKSRRNGRSFPLAALAPLAAIANVRLISLQKNEGVEELDDLPTGMTVETLGEDYEPGGDFFLDVGGVMQVLDLVVSPDTSLAHVAGALGRPTWLALDDAAEWRWLLDRADSPWYPSARLFRQRARGDWGGVMADMAAALREKLGR